MKTTLLYKSALLMLFSAMVIACNNTETPANVTEPEEQPAPPTFEERLCHKWECWKMMFGEIERDFGENSSYLLFKEDGTLEIEDKNSEEVQKFTWRKHSEEEIEMLMPTPKEELSEALKMLPMLNLDEDSFRDTLRLDAEILELTDTTLVMSSVIVWKDMFTTATVLRLSLIPQIKDILDTTTKCTLYLRKEESEKK